MIAVQPAPSCLLVMVNQAAPAAAGADVVVDVDGHLVHLIIPIPGQLGVIRLGFTASQLGALMDELVSASELVTA